MKRVILLVVAAGLSEPAYGWDGTDTETGASIEIGKGNLVREGRDIEIYDAETGNYRDVTIEGINRYGSGVEIEVYDSESGEYRTFEMEDD